MNHTGALDVVDMMDQSRTDVDFESFNLERFALQVSIQTFNAYAFVPGEHQSDIASDFAWFLPIAVVLRDFQKYRGYTEVRRTPIGRAVM